MHMYEIRKREENGTVTTIRLLATEQKEAMKTFKEYAEANPGVYSLYQVRRIKTYISQKELDRDD